MGHHHTSLYTNVHMVTFEVMHGFQIRVVNCYLITFKMLLTLSCQNSGNGVENITTNIAILINLIQELKAYS